MRTLARLIFLVPVFACTEPVTIEATVEATGVSVAATGPIQAAELRDASGMPVLRVHLPVPASSVALTGPLEPGPYTVVASVDGGSVSAAVTIEERPPLRVELQPVPGGPWLPLEDRTIPVVEGGVAEVLVGLTGGPGMPAEVNVQGERVPLEVEGQRVLRALRLGELPLRLSVGDRVCTLTPQPFTLASVRQRLSVTSDVFPAESTGAPDLGRPAGRVTLPSPIWDGLIRSIGLGGRRRDDVAPWGFWGITLENSGVDPLDVQVSLEVEEAGASAPAFRPRLRSGDGDTGVVTALVRIPSGGVTAALPVFVDTAAVQAGAYTVVLRVTPLGSSSVIHELRRPLYVVRGDALASIGFGVSLLAALVGVGLIVGRLRTWLLVPTSDLMTIALFGSALFVVGTVSDLVAMGVGVVLGPFSTLFTGLLSDLGRYTLLATLVALVPRPGTLALAVITGTFLRGFTTGSYSPTDLLYLGMSVGYTEGFAWIAGLTRGSWVGESATRRWIRLSVAFAGASVCITLSGLWLHVVLSRLFFAPWYIAMQAIGPGFLYTIIACRVATGFAASLREVEP